MKQGKSRFDCQLNKIETLRIQAVKQENPAEWLFLNDMRTPMFMLEALSKMYANWHNKKIFEKLNEIFKTLEDTLGAIDYYAAFEKEFADNAETPTAVKSFLTERKKEQIEKLYRLLKEDGWFSGKRLRKINDKLAEVDWLNEADEHELLKTFYQQEIKKIVKFTLKTRFIFNNVEEDVHELRRRLRWLSIYPQAMQGAIKLAPLDPLSKHLEKYLTPDIVNSPYNKFPTSDTQSLFLILDESYFYALSWMIKELGKIKDQGLKINVLQEAFAKDESPLETAYKILGNDYPRIETLLESASRIVKQYFEEDNLNHIIV